MILDEEHGMMRGFIINYADGVFAERIWFAERVSFKDIVRIIQETIDSYNLNPNEKYHIGWENVQEVSL